MSVSAFVILLDNGQATECCQIVASGDDCSRKALIFKGLRWSDCRLAKLFILFFAKISILSPK